MSFNLASRAACSWKWSKTAWVKIGSVLSSKLYSSDSLRLIDVIFTVHGLGRLVFLHNFSINDRFFVFFAVIMILLRFRLRSGLTAAGTFTRRGLV